MSIQAKKKRRHPKDWTILVVDNDAQVRQVLLDYLTNFGFENVLLAQNGHAALEIIRKPKQRLDIVLSDWEMPSMNGLGLLRALRKMKARQHVGFIMITSGQDREITKVLEASKYRIDGYVVKPFRGQVLRDKIEDYMKSLKPNRKKKVLKTAGRTKIKSGELQTDEPTELVGRVKIVEGAVKTKGMGEDLGSVLFKDGKLGAIGSVEYRSNLLGMLRDASRYKEKEWFDIPINLFSKFLESMPDNIEVMYYLALSYQYRGSIEESLDWTKRALIFDPDNPTLTDLLADLRRKKVS
ncbi:MAG: response regulator [Bdellovibrionia bacterium]